MSELELVVKRWGNSFAVRLPVEIPGLGRLHEGMHLKAQVETPKKVKDWRPLTFRGGPPDASVRHDEILADLWDEELNRWRSSTRASSSRS